MQRKKNMPAAAQVSSDQVGKVFQKATDFYLRGRLREAEPLYREILKNVPDHFDALHLLGVIEAQKKNSAAAVELMNKALRVNPQDAAAHSNLANVLLILKRFEEALNSCDRALELQPDFADAHGNRGIALRGLNRFEDSLASCDRALELRPNFAEAHISRATALGFLGRFQESLDACDSALALRRNYLLAHSNRAMALRFLGRFQESLDACDCALAVKPDHAETLNTRGDMLSEFDRYEEAAECFEKLIGVAPDYPYAPGLLLMSKCCACNWTDYDSLRSSVDHSVEEGRVAVRSFAFMATSDSPADQLTCARVHFQSIRLPSSNPLWRGEVYRHKKIRLAYVSADFYNHPMAWLMLGLFEQHDRSRFETIAISYGPHKPGRIRTRLENAFDRFIDVRGKSAREIAQLIRDLEIDIAIDRKGYTLDAMPEIFAFRPAPIQAQYLAYPGTVGTENIDYILADPIVIPKAHHMYYTENVVYLPECYQVNDSNRHISLQIPDRGQAGLPEDGFVFCCFNRSNKITPQVFEIWMNLLRKVDHSVLWLLQDNVEAVRNLRLEAAKRDVMPERLVFAQRMEQAQHLGRHRLADLFLDTLPFNAHTTASDALWTGLPIVTCTGNTFAGRVATSLLNAIGLPELITSDLDAYDKLAHTLATNSALLSDIKGKLRKNRTTHPLFDTDRSRRHIEEAYIAMWERYQDNKPPEGFSVTPL